MGMQPGMIVEIASPPGGGKSSLIMSVLMSARMNGEGEVTEDEVLVIGMCDRWAAGSGPHRLMLAMTGHRRRRVNDPLEIQIGGQSHAGTSCLN